MRISHGTATSVEHLVRNAWDFDDRGYLCGMIDADHFEKYPYDALCLLVAPFEYKNHRIREDHRITATVDKFCYLSQDRIDEENGQRTNLTDDEELDFFQSLNDLHDYLNATY